MTKFKIAEHNKIVHRFKLFANQFKEDPRLDAKEQLFLRSCSGKYSLLMHGDLLKLISVSTKHNLNFKFYTTGQTEEVPHES